MCLPMHTGLSYNRCVCMENRCISAGRGGQWGECCTCVYLGQCVTMEVVSLCVSHISGLTQVLACAPSNIAVDNLVERLSAARAKVGGGSECMCE